MSHSLCVVWLIHVCDRLIPLCYMTHSCVWYSSFLSFKWLIQMFDMSHWTGSSRESARHMCDTTRAQVWHGSFICVTWLIGQAAAEKALDIWVTLLVPIFTWRIHMCDMTHSYVWHDSFIYVTWLIRQAASEKALELRVILLFLCVTWLICVTMTQSTGSSRESTRNAGAGRACCSRRCSCCCVRCARSCQHVSICVVWICLYT